MFGLPDMRPVYLDYAATTPVDDQVADAMQDCLRLGDNFGNASSNHAFGERAALAEERARSQLAAALNVQPSEVIWTSGATESDNLAIIGVARYRRDKGQHLVTARTEHKAVVDAFRYLEREGFSVTWLTPSTDGRIAPDQVAAALQDDTTLVSLMAVNNEIGVVNDLDAIADVVGEHGALLHVDAAQAFGKMHLDLATVPIDLLSVTAHKCYGPKGIGALFVSKRLGGNLEPLLYGGGQQRGLRPGTLPIHQIAGFGVAAELASQRLDADYARLTELGERLRRGLLSVPDVALNGSQQHRLPWLVNVSVGGVDGESLLAAMSPVALATGSACHAMRAEPSVVLKAHGLSDARAGASLRFSAGRGTTADDIDLVIERFEQAVGRLRQIAGPLWCAS